MNKRQTIDQFLHEKKLAIAGVSHNPKKFGHMVYQIAKEKGYSVIPINPKGGIIGDIAFVESVSKLSGDVKNLLIVTHKRDTKKVMEEAISKGIKNVWIQQGSETDDVLKLAREQGFNLVSKACFLMYVNPKGIHKFHQTLAKWFGSYTKEIASEN
jgi:predicted CoA-binding protein